MGEFDTNCVTVQVQKCMTHPQCETTYVQQCNTWEGKSGIFGKGLFDKLGKNRVLDRLGKNKGGKSKEECQDVPVERCHNVRICNPEQEEQCEQVPRDVCVQVPRPHC